MTGKIESRVQPDINRIATAAATKAVENRVWGAVEVLANVPMPSGDHVFATSPQDAITAKITADACLTWLYPNNTPTENQLLRRENVFEARRIINT